MWLLVIWPSTNSTPKMQTKFVTSSFFCFVVAVLLRMQKLCTWKYLLGILLIQFLSKSFVFIQIFLYPPAVSTSCRETVNFIVFILDQTHLSIKKLVINLFIFVRDIKARKNMINNFIVQTKICYSPKPAGQMYFVRTCSKH